MPNGSFWQGSFRAEFPKTIPKEEYDKIKNSNMNRFIGSIQEDKNET